VPRSHRRSSRSMIYDDCYRDSLSVFLCCSYTATMETAQGCQLPSRRHQGSSLDYLTDMKSLTSPVRTHFVLVSIIIVRLSIIFRTTARLSIERRHTPSRKATRRKKPGGRLRDRLLPASRPGTLHRLVFLREDVRYMSFELDISVQTSIFSSWRASRVIIHSLFEIGLILSPPHGFAHTRVQKETVQVFQGLSAFDAGECRLVRRSICSARVAVSLMTETK
jgi:hypothetical protein